MRPVKNLAIAAVAVCIASLAATGSPASASASAVVTRVAGSDRFDTAATVSSSRFTSGVPVAYIANGLNFPDALSGGPAAAHSKGPVLLTTPSAIPSPTMTELKRLKPKRIVVLGGAAAVSPSVAALLGSLTSGPVVRESGDDRFETAAQVSASTFASGVSVVYVASGFNFPDALAGGPVAARGDGPVLLTTPGALPVATANELKRLKPKKIVLLGGTGAIAAAVVSQLSSLAPSVTRVAGTDRFETAANASASAFPAGAAIVYIANGFNFPDALAGGPVAGLDRGPVLLTTPTGLPPATEKEVKRLNPKKIVVLGGVKAVADTVLTQLRNTGPSAAAPTITTTSLPGGAVGQPYAASLRATGGTSPYSWKASGLPAGLTLASTGSLSGTPTTRGSWHPTFTAKDSAGKSATTSIALSITANAITGSTPSISGNARVGQVLTAIPGAWSPASVSLSYRWLSSGAPIAGANAATVTLGIAQAGTVITVAVTGTKSGYSAVTKASAPSAAVMGPPQLNPDETLHPGQFLQSPNGTYRLLMQADGNLVELDGGGGAVWASGTTGNNFLAQQPDGNLVIYRSTGGAIWATNTNVGGPATTVMQDDGNLVVWQGSTPLWTRAVTGYGTVKPAGGTQGMTAPTLTSSQRATYPAGRTLGFICYAYGQTVKGYYGSGNLWHQLPDTNYAPDVDLNTGVNGPLPGERQCSGGGGNAPSIDGFVAKYNGAKGVPNVAGTYPGQCVSLISQYLSQIYGITSGAWGNAVDYRAGGSGGNQLQARSFGWHNDTNFQNGDILVWGQSAASGTGAAGHIGIWYNGRVFDQNDGRNGRAYDPATGTYAVGFANFFSGGFLGYWSHG